MKEYYTYIYYDTDWVAYYVGKGRHNRLAFKQSLTVPPKERIHVFHFDEEWEAYECEIDLIKFWGRKQDGGTLDNVALGGPGAPGVKPNDETRARLSAARHKLPNANDIISKMRQACIKPIKLIHTKTYQELSFESGEAACEALDIHRSCLSGLRHGKRNTCKGWKLHD